MGNFIDLAFIGELIKFSSSYTKKRNTILILQIVGNILMVLFWFQQKQYDLSCITILAILSSVHSKKKVKNYYYWIIPYSIFFYLFYTSIGNIFLGLLPFFSRGGLSSDVIKSRFVICFLYYISYSFYFSYYSILFWSCFNLILLLISFKKFNIEFILFDREN
jgi:hypothetical protein